MKFAQSRIDALSLRRDGPSVSKTSCNLMTSANNMSKDRMSLSQGVGWL